MRRLSISGRASALAVALLLMLTATLITTGAGAPTAQALSLAPAITTPSACDIPMAGQHIYDCAGLLTTAEISALEAKAQAAQDAGAAVVVYLQVKDTGYDQTLKDAADLMARWNVESRPGAKDGLVILLNLKSGDLRHGQLALYAGRTLLDGPLPQNELNRIYQDVMLPDLQAGQTASGIGAGLDAAAVDIRAGRPVTPTTPAQRVARAIGTIPFNVLAALLALLALALGVTSWRRTREVSLSPALISSAPPHEPLPPAVAGALITGRVSGAQMEATILDFARRGLLNMEPVSPKKAQIRLLGDDHDLTGYEQLLWLALESQATHDHVIPPNRLAHVTSGWRQAMDALRHELYDQGWFDRDVGSKRLPLYILLTISGVLALVGVILGALAQQPWPFIGVALCVIAGGAALVFALIIPSRTPAGSAMALVAREYLASLTSGVAGADVSQALPWLVAADQTGAYRQQLLMASAHPVNEFAAIYPYWLLIHTSMAPQTTSAGVAGATGAAAGGGGAGGAF